MNRRKLALLIARATVFVVLGVLAALFFLHPPEIQTDLIGLLGKPNTPHSAALLELSRSTEKRIQVLVEAENFDDAKTAAKIFLENLRNVPVEIDAGEFSENETASVIDFYARERFNFLSDEDRASLIAGHFDEVSARAAQLWFAPVTSPISRKIDPFGTLTRFLADLPNANGNFSLRDGFLSAKFGECEFIFIALKLPETASLADTGTTLGKLASIRVPAAKIHVSGTPLHSVSTAQKSVRELNILTALGVGFVTLLLLALFRSLRALGLAVTSISAGLLGGFFTTAAIFQNVHTFTLLFGTTLIGLAVDYTFHAYLRRGNAVIRPLCSAFATSTLAFGILVFSSFSVLKQTAVFSISGLAFVLATTLLFREKILGNAPFPPLVDRAEMFTRKTASALRFFLRKGGILLLVPFVAFGLARISFSDDIRTLYRPSQNLLQNDLLFMQVSGQKPTTRFFVSTGNSLEEILQNEEKFSPPNTRSLSAFLPSAARQHENFELQKKFYENEKLSTKLGLKNAFPSPEKFNALGADALPPALQKIFAALYHRTPQGDFSATALTTNAPDILQNDATSECFVVSPVEEISAMLVAAKRQTYALLLGAFTVLFAVLFLIFRRGSLRLWTAPLCSALTVAATLGWLGIPLSFFHLLAFFLIVGLAVDYGIFRLGETRSELAVWLSCATSALSFGLLAFTEFSLLRSFGLTLALGFVFSFLFSLFLAKDDTRETPHGNAGEWFSQKENHAGTLRLELLRFVYKTCPLCVFRTLLGAVSFSIFLASPKVRRASKKFIEILNADERSRGVPESRFSTFTHVNSFANAVFDRFDAASGNRQKLKIELAHGTPTEEFAQGGATFLCTHTGNIEIFQNIFRSHPELPIRVMNAFQEVGQNSIFFNFYKKYCARDFVKIWDVEKIDLATATALAEALGRGEFVMLAADRVSAGTPEKTIPAQLLGQEIALPKGAFSIARMLGAPIYFVACVKTSPRVYTFFAERAPEKGVSAAYARFLEKLTRAYPTQFFNFFEFFKGS